MSFISKKLLYLSCVLFVMSFDVLAMELQERQLLKQELLKELIEGDALKQYVKKEIQLYETEKIKLKTQQKRQRQNKINAKAQKVIRPVSLTRDHIYGDQEAPISIIEFSDFECPYCRKIHPVLKKLVNGSDGQVNWVFRHYPLSFHKPNAQVEAEASECVAHIAKNTGFWVFIDTLFSQPRRGKQDRTQLINRAAQKVNVKTEDLEQCKKNGQFASRVNEDEKEALAIGLRGTPANVIVHNGSNTIRIRQGAASLQTLRNDINELQKAIEK